MACNSRFKPVRHNWSLRQRLEHYTDRNGGPDACWTWMASSTNEGYGKIFFERRLHLAHRKWWEVTNGPIPVGMYLCHKCDNPICVNPNHMFVGTPADNARDMIRKQRGAQGEKQHMAKLTAERVMAIRNDPRPQAAIASDYGITQSNVSCIRRGLTWGHVGGPRQFAENLPYKRGRSRLTEDAIRSIRRDSRENVQIARDLGIDPSSVSRIKARKAFAGVSDAP